jgi:2-C-methyl-D-erythritol 4-phosphate cytidylyltransferase
VHVHAVVIVSGSSDVRSPLGGVPVVVRAVRAMLGAPGVTHVDLLVPPDRVPGVVAVCTGLPVAVHGSVAALWAHAGQRSGGTLGDGPMTRGSCVLVHDAARPLVPVDTVRSVVDAVRRGHRVVVPVLPLADTVKEVDADGRVLSTPDRGGLRVVQTPQGFDGALLGRVLPAARRDPVHAWSGAGESVHTVPGHPLAFAVHDDWHRDLAERAVLA